MIFFDSISIQILSGVKIVIKQLKEDKRRRTEKKKPKDFLAGEENFEVSVNLNKIFTFRKFN